MSLPTVTSSPHVSLIAASALLCAVMLPTSVSAQAAWPSKSVRIVNNFPAGGPSDILARAQADGLQKASGQSVIVENKPGAGGNIGAAEVAKAAGDGGTVFCGIDTAFTVNPHIFPSMPFKLGNRAGELKPLIMISANGLMLGASSAKGIRSMGELFALGKSRGLNFSSGGAGSPGHLGVAIFSQSANIKITHVPYRGASPAVMAIVSGEVDGGILTSSGLLPQVKAGKVVPIAVTSRTRSKLVPDIPTVKELGYPELENEVLTLCMVPGDTPDALLAAMQKSTQSVLQQSALQDRIAAMDMVYEGLTGATAMRRLNELSARYGKIVKATGMKVE